MLVLVIIGLLSIISGYLYVFRPDIVIKLSGIGNRLITTDYGFIRYHKFSGLVLLCVGCLLFYVGIKFL